jgi:hypothetical protein
VLGRPVLHLFLGYLVLHGAVRRVRRDRVLWSGWYYDR